MFAKLFGGDSDQVLVKLDMNEDGNPEVRVYFEPEGFGVCSIAIGWNDDSDESWNLATKAFKKMDERSARALYADSLKRMMGKGGG